MIISMLKVLLKKGADLQQILTTYGEHAVVSELQVMVRDDPDIVLKTAIVLNHHALCGSAARQIILVYGASSYTSDLLQLAEQYKYHRKRI